MLPCSYRGPPGRWHLLGRITSELELQEVMMLTEDPQSRECVSSLSLSHPGVTPWVADVEMSAVGKE